MKTRITFLLLIWMSLCLTLSAQTNAKISIEFKETPLPTALKRLEQASGYRILFTYSDVENYQVRLPFKMSSSPKPWKRYWLESH